jgi:uncharacterized protein
MPSNSKNSSKANFHVIIKPSGATCNLNCQYCFYLPKKQLYPKSNYRMSEQVLEAFTQQYIEAHSGPQIIFGWQGGEPALMGLDFFQKALKLQQKYQPPNISITNTFQTNTTLLTAEWAKFFHEHNFLVGVSLDGPTELHNVYRIDSKKKGTHEKVMQAVELLKRFQVEYNILTCVHQGNVHEPLKVYRFLTNRLKVQHIQFIPIVVRDHPLAYQKGNQIRPLSVDSESFGRFLIEIFDDWYSHDIGKVFIQTFESTLASVMGQPGGLCAYSPYCSASLALEHNGDLYCCDHFVEPDYLLGNILETPLIELVNSQKYKQFVLNKIESLPKYCRNCPVLGLCYGACPKDRVKKTPDGEIGLNYLCEGYKAFFKYCLPYFQEIAQKIRNNSI